MPPSNFEIQKAFREFATLDGWHSPFAVTLTMKQGRYVDTGKGQAYQALNQEYASSNMRDFLNRLNQQVFGNAAIRFGKAVAVIPIIDGGNGKNLHYPCLIDCPRDELQAVYPNLITRLWNDTAWGRKIVDVQAKADNGFTKYSSKLRDKLSYPDSFDWANYHLVNR